MIRHKNLKIFLLFSVFIISLFLLAYTDFPGGYVGTTKKYPEPLGCICHGSSANDTISVNITGPDSVAAGQTAIFKVSVSHGPAIIGGFNIAADTGLVNPLPGDTNVHIIAYPDTTVFELTHAHPKPFVNDTVSWFFLYTAPNFAYADTLYASGNSSNNDTTSENDKWNWSPNKPVRVYIPIGIVNISSIAKDFSISQNYPNPFNPVTQIKFSVAKSSYVKIRVFDIAGSEVQTLVNGNFKTGAYVVDFNASSLASGVYFYALYADGMKLDTKKMMFIK
ncbi:MAG: T9SS type A sorting domain-containing protein [Ignavibacteria bacterium]|nr:T9SS type A sorting domain-containing protein [Ignavibacteria bacterium]MCC7158290.1 T9SS type A sorting domain-containing protein [Ignavibacteria bacterium]